jgi:hypothetical protein
MSLEKISESNENGNGLKEMSEKELTILESDLKKQTDAAFKTAKELSAKLNLVRTALWDKRKSKKFHENRAQIAQNVRNTLSGKMSKIKEEEMAEMAAKKKAERWMRWPQIKNEGEARQGVAAK